MACGGGESTTDSVNDADVRPTENQVEQAQGFNLNTTQIRNASSANPQELQAWVDLLNERAFVSTSHKSNFIDYPYTRMSMLAALSLGATSGTATGIIDELTLDDTLFDSGADNSSSNDITLFYSAFNSLDQQLTSEAVPTPSNSIPFVSTPSFTSANSYWGQEDYAFSRDFVDDSIGYFGAELHSVNFSDDNSVIEAEIEQWLIDNSDYSHEGTMPEVYLNDDGILLVGHANRFTSAWLSPFDSANDELTEFALFDDETIEVMMMRGLVDAQYYSEGDTTILELPFVDDNWALYLVTSTDIDNYDSFMDELTIDELNSLKSKMSLTSLDLTLPPFFIEGSSSLSSVSNINNKDTADFSAINQQLLDNLYVTSAYSAHNLSFNHNGLQLSAYGQSEFEHKPEPVAQSNNSSTSYSVTTSWSCSDCSSNSKPEPPEIIVSSFNSPFKYFLYHKQSELILLSGNVSKPETE